MIPQFSPTLVALNSSLGLEIFFAFIYLAYWLYRKSDKPNLYLALWFTGAAIYTVSRLLQFYSHEISLTPYYGKLGAVTHFIIIWIGMRFVNAYVRYKPNVYERIFWIAVTVIPIVLIITSEVFITNQPVQRQTIFGESFYGAYQGVLYLPIASIRPLLLLLLFIRLFNKRKRNENRYVLAGFAFLVLFSVNDMTAVFLNLVWLRVYDFIFLPLGIAYTLELIKNYNTMYNRMEALVEDRTKELTTINKQLNEEIIIRSEAEKEASVNKEKFFGIYNAVNEVIFIHDAVTGAIVDVNNKMLEVFKCTREKALRLSVADFSENVPPFTQKEANEYFEMARHGKEILFEWRSKDLTGKIFWSEISMHSATIGSQQFILVSLRDVSKRKETENELSVYQLHLEELVNQRTVELDRAVMEQMSLNEALQKVNEELKTQRNEIMIALENLKIAQSQIVESEKMAALGLLTAGIAHEINNPLNYLVVSSYSLEAVITDLKNAIDYSFAGKQFAAGSMKDSADCIKQIEQFIDELKKINSYIARGTERISEIIKGLRLFARSDNEKKYEIDIHEHIDAVFVMLEHELSERIQVVKQYGEIPKYKCFPGKLGQVFMNLLMNSIQAIEDNGEIKIITGLSEDRSCIMISVKDTGCGIPENIKEKIFEPFFTTKEVGQGTGLGLSIVFGIINEHKGKITVESKKNKGTEMLISLPL